MPLIVEDGTGLTTSDSYASLAEFRDYFTKRGDEVTADKDDDKVEPALRKATDYIDLRFGGRMQGVRLVEGQALEFPRDVFDGIPVVLKRACIEYASRALAGPLAPDLDVEANGMAPASKKEKIGPIEESTTYHASTPRSFKRYPAVDSLMRTLLQAGGGIVRG